MTANVPVRTAPGNAELRSRSLGLSQRHRTVLLLVDGRRPLADVLSLALKAGSTTNHFEDLVRHGLVELPVEAAAPDPVMTEPGALYTPRISSVELAVAPGAAPRDEPDTAGPAAAADDAAAGSHDASAAGAVLEPPIARDDVVPAEPAADDAPEPPGIDAATPSRHAAAERDAASDEPLAEGSPAGAPSAEPIVEQVRALLVETVRHHPPPFGLRLGSRLAVASTSTELMAVVWEIEAYLSPARRSRGGLESLYRARDLLGLGNTVVADDGRADWRDA